MSKSLDRLTLLATFTRIAERGSISAAARDIGLSQASASRQLAELEDRLGVQLIRRTTHALSLTEDGEDVLAEARGLLEGWEALTERYANATGAVRGKLKVVAPVALGQLHLARAALAFQTTYPDVSLTWLLDDANIRFAEAGCDLWIKIGAPPDDTLIVKNIASVERLVVAAPRLLKAAEISAQTMTPRDLNALPCAALTPFEGGTIPLTSQRGKTVEISPQVTMTTNNIFSAYEAAKRGVGIVVLPRWLVEKDLTANKLVDVLPAWRAPSLTITAAYLPANRQTKRLKLFIDHMVETITTIPGVRTE